MKKIEILMLCIFFHVLNSQAQIQVSSNYNIGIGTMTPLSWTNVHMANGGNQTYLFLDKGTDGPTYGLGLVSGGTNFNGGGITTYSSHLFKFCIWNASTGGYNVGINMNNPSYVLDVNGDINTSSSVRVAGVIKLSSDERLKNNIKNLSGSLASLTNLRGVTYKFKRGYIQIYCPNSSSFNTTIICFAIRFLKIKLFNAKWY